MWLGSEKLSNQPSIGYGLSSTGFDYSDLKVSPSEASPGQPLEVSLQVRNSGSRPGAEIVEFYVHDGHSSADRPIQELKGWSRVAGRTNGWSARTTIAAS